MFKIPATALPAPDLALLAGLQSNVDSIGSYPQAVAEGKRLWDTKPKLLFTGIRDLLKKMCSGNTRCIYCEDSLADEIEHMRPKSLYPEAVFVWGNYVLACGTCNNPKNNKFAVIDTSTGNLVVVTRKRKDVVQAPLAGQSALIDPRAEDPLDYLWLDFITWRYVPIHESGVNLLRAQFTINVLGLNVRDEFLRGRCSAFSGFKARLETYCSHAAVWTQAQRDAFVADFRVERYRTVWLEMIRQRSARPDIDGLLTQAPAALAW